MIAVLTNKMVVIIAAEAPIGVALNTAALLGVGVGRHHDDTVGPDTTDAAGQLPTGMCAYPIPILRAPAQHPQRAPGRGRRPSRRHHPRHAPGRPAEPARTSRCPPHSPGTKPEDIQYLGLALYGPRTSPSTP